MSEKLVTIPEERLIKLVEAERCYRRCIEIMVDEAIIQSNGSPGKSEADDNAMRDRAIGILRKWKAPFRFEIGDSFPHSNIRTVDHDFNNSRHYLDNLPVWHD